LIPVSAGLIRLYADYLHGEYGDLDCDYVFVNLWGQPRGHPLGYPAVYDLVRRLRRRTGIGFDPHWCRHTAATRMQGRGVASDATFREKREHPRPGLQLPRPSQRAGKVREQSGDDLRCQHLVASNQTTLQLLPLHPVTRVMRQMQRKSAATRKDATTARSSGSGIRQVW